MTAEGDVRQDTGVDAGRWELMRALGALSALMPPESDRLAGPLGLAAWSRAEHTQLFVLDLPPYASIHLGPEGKLGGEGADRVAGVWRALGLTPPADADHLAALLALYSELGEAALASRTAAVRQRLDHVRTAVLWEHLWSWVPGYLAAVRLSSPWARPWADLVMAALSREAAWSQPATLLPLALRDAPPPMGAEDSYDQMLDAVTAPVRVGFLITHGDLAQAAQQLGLGLRRGERRFVLRGMLEQDAASTLEWLAEHARGWARRHGERPPVACDPGPWWAERAWCSAAVLDGWASRTASAAAVAT